MYFSRNNYFHNIIYYIIADRDDPGLLPPKSLDALTFAMIQTLPKSVLQILYPREYYITSIVKGCTQNMQVGVCYSDNFPDFIDSEPYTQQILSVFFLNTTDQVCFNSIKKIKRPLLISSILPRVSDTLKNDETLGPFYFDNTMQFLDILLNNADMIVDEINAYREKNGIKPTIDVNTQSRAEDLIHEDFTSLLHHLKEDHKVDTRESLRRSDFKPCHVNYMTFNQLDYANRNFSFKPEKTAHDKRAEALIESCLQINKIEFIFKKVEIDGKVFNQTVPLILSFPYHPTQRIKQLIKNHRDKNPEDIQLMRWVSKGILAEQSCKNYDVQLNNHGLTKDNLLAFQTGTQYNAERGLFIDNMAHLHASFYSSPYIRLPMQGVSINKWLHPFDLDNYKATRNFSKVHNNLKKFGENAAQLIPQEIIDYLNGCSDQVIAISDLPVEWIQINGVPIAFLMDVCRLPETPFASLMAQYASNSFAGFKIDSSIIKNTLVVCGAPDDKTILDAFKAAKDMVVKIIPDPPTFVICHNINEFFDAVNKHKPKLLIIDSHGDYSDDLPGSFINMGMHDKLNGTHIVESQINVPIVILQCCNNAPIYGRESTIAQAFFETGTKSVIGTFLPVSILKNATLTGRLIWNLYYAAKHAVHPNWLSFVSHNLRTAYFDDMKWRLSDAGIANDAFLQEDYIKSRGEWQVKSMDRVRRRDAYLHCKETLLSCLHPQSIKKASGILNISDFIPEFLYYTHLGRGDLILFESWTQEHHVPDTPFLLPKKKKP